ncbi:MAG: hypothetical protein ABWY71_01485 [Candidatus Saccharimonadales bacterium]
MAGPVVEIACATLNTYPVDLPGRPSWGSGIEEMAGMLARTQFASVEVHPTKALVASAQRLYDAGEGELVETVVGSTHQTFFNGDGVIEKIARYRGVLSSVDSLGGIATIQSFLSIEVPAVMLPDLAPEGGYTDENTGSLLRVMQPCAEQYRDLAVKYPDLDVRTNAGLLEAARREGLVGFCPDLAHARRQAEDGTETPPIEEVWGDQFASGAVYQAHAALDRRDMAKRDPELAARSAEEFQQFASGDWRKALLTQAGEMIVEGTRLWRPPSDLSRPVLRWVIETPPLPKEILRREGQLARCVQSLAGIIQHARGTPILWANRLPVKRGRHAAAHA